MSTHSDCTGLRHCGERGCPYAGRTPEFSYIRLPDGKAKVTCTCGWEDPLGPMPVSPFDPREALAAAGAEHLRCHKLVPSFHSVVERETHERELARQERTTKRVEAIVATIKTQLTGAGVAIVDERMLMAGLTVTALVIGAELDRTLEAIARNILQVIDLEEELSCPA